MIRPAAVAAVCSCWHRTTGERLAGHEHSANPDRVVFECRWRRTIPADPRRLVRYKLKPDSRLFHP